MLGRGGTDLSIKCPKRINISKNLSVSDTQRIRARIMASRIESGESEVYRWLSSISQRVNLQRLAPESERRGFRTKYSLKYMAQNDLDIIINSPDKM